MVTCSKKVLFLSIIVLSLISTIVNASLLGDTVFARSAFYDASYFRDNHDSLGLVYYDEVLLSEEIIEVGPIVDGASDEIAISDAGSVESPSYTIYATIDVNSTSFSLNFFDFATSWNGQFNSSDDEFNGFSGYVISDFDYAPGYVISDITVQNNLVNLDGGVAINFTDNTPLLFTEERISFTDDKVFLDFAGLSFRTLGSLDFQLSFEPSPVPLPPALWLFASGLFGLVSLCRKKHKFV